MELEKRDEILNLNPNTILIDEVRLLEAENLGMPATHRVRRVGDLSHVMGVSGEFTEGMDFVYAGENDSIDHLSPTDNGFALLSNSSPTYDCGIAADAGT